MTQAHDFSPHSLRCVNCGVPTTHRDTMECRPSEADGPVEIAALHEAIAVGNWDAFGRYAG